VARKNARRVRTLIRFGLLGRCDGHGDLSAGGDQETGQRPVVIQNPQPCRGSLDCAGATSIESGVGRRIYAATVVA
jgi:hypothetical protein